MTPRQRALLGVLGGLVVLTGLALALFARRDGDDRRVTSRPATTTSSTATSTTEPGPGLQPGVRPEPPTTAPSTTPTTAPPPPSTSTTAPQPVVTGEGAVLRRPAAAETRTMRPGGGCDTLADQGWTARCGQVKARARDLIWLVETRGNGRRALVFQRGTGLDWVLVLQAADDDGSRWTDVSTRVEDVSGDGAQEISYGFHGRSPTVLGVDVVEGPGNVVVHRDLARGSARVRLGQLETWAGEYAAGQPECCPSNFVHDRIRFTGGAWRIVASERVPPSDVPPSEL